MWVQKPKKKSAQNVECTIDNSVIMCDEVITTTKSILLKTVPTKSTPINFNEVNLICKKKNFYFLLAS